MIIVLGIVITILVALLVYKYEAIEAMIFDREDLNFSSIGGDTIKLCTLCGALVGAVEFIYQTILDRSAFSLGYSSIWGFIVNGLPYVAFGFVSFCVYKVFILEVSLGWKIGRSLFIVVASVMGMIGGAIVSVLAIVVIVLFFILTVFTKSSFSGSGVTAKANSSNDYDATTVDENGFERKLKKTGAFSYRDDKGNEWEDDGLGKKKKKN